MPIYAYRCASCGHARDVLQKMSDPVLTQCPACGADTFVKQLTAAGFQLKGSGWYVTDFRGGNNAAAKPDKAEGGDKAAADAAGEKSGDKGGDKPAEKTADKSADKGSDKSADKSTDKSTDKTANKTAKGADKPSSAPSPAPAGSPPPASNT